MYRIQLSDAGDDLGTIIATLVTTQQASLLPPRYRPLIGMLASPSTSVDGQRQVMSTDLASIEALLAAGGEVRLIPVRLPAAGEEAFELVLHTVLQFDGLLFSCSAVDPHLDGHENHAPLEGPGSLLDWWMVLMALVARETLTPLFGICRGAAQLRQAFGGTLRQQRPAHHVARGRAHNGVMHSLDLDPERLALCVRGGQPHGASRLPAIGRPGRGGPVPAPLRARHTGSRPSCLGLDRWRNGSMGLPRPIALVCARDALSFRGSGGRGPARLSVTLSV